MDYIAETFKAENGIDLRKALLGKTCKIKARSKYIDENIEIYDVKNASILR